MKCSTVHGLGNVYKENTGSNWQLHAGDYVEICPLHLQVHESRLSIECRGLVRQSPLTDRSDMRAERTTCFNNYVWSNMHNNSTHSLVHR